jgi:hypothetical protein
LALLGWRTMVYQWKTEVEHGAWAEQHWRRVQLQRVWRAWRASGQEHREGIEQLKQERQVLLAVSFERWQSLALASRCAHLPS